MPKYIGLINWTEAGMRTAKDTVKRAKASREELKTLGVKIENIYWALGPYDIILTFDAPDGEAAVKARLSSIMKGNLRWTILRLFNEDEMGKLIEQLP
jgi:uncharacterized protein with GYD domain